MAERHDALLIHMPSEHVALLSGVLGGSGPPSVNFGNGKATRLFENTSIQFVGQESDWVYFEPADAQQLNPWDHAHNKVSELLTLNAQLSPEQLYVEPNSRSETEIKPTGTGGESLLSMPSQTDSGVSSGPPYAPLSPLNTHYPPALGPSLSPAWHLQHCKFPDAWVKTKGKDVRIAHLDIGWWEEHYSKPMNIRKDLGKNFVENDDNTQDPQTAIANIGHGTATLALLAGNEVSLKCGDGAPGTENVYQGFIGGAPEAEVVPVRIAGVGGSVVYLYGDTMARGLDYALNPSDGKKCDVVSLSHGGLPSECWATRINALYEAGVVVVAASGDSFWAVVTDIATHFTVYPSAFYRVETATGTTFDGGPYKRDEIGVMQGCWGPSKVMDKAVAGPTPNVPWMKVGTQFGWDFDGGGTSASTPQIAAACALWLSLYGKELPDDWHKVEACRLALKLSVDDVNGDPVTIGLGRLNVAKMLSKELADSIIQLVNDGKLNKTDPDSVSFPLIRLLLGLPPPGDGVNEPTPKQKMFMVEIAQTLYKSKNPNLIKLFQSHAEDSKTSPNIEALRQELLTEDISTALHQQLSAPPSPASTNP